MSSFSSIRLSKHFLLLDFLNGHTLYSSGVPLSLDQIPPSHIRTGQRLCEELLEPMIRAWGPMSISNGFIPTALLSGRFTPHTWAPRDGAAADIVVHNWVNSGFSPIALVREIIGRQLPFERLITYAGSEVMCVSAGREPRNRAAVYENIRVPGKVKPAFKAWHRGGSYPSHLLNDGGIVNRPDWRRTEGELPYHTKSMLRPQHIRVSRYFLALDFFRNEAAITSGIPWAFTPRKKETLQALCCMGEVLDRVVEQVGRISVTRGIIRPGDDVMQTHTWEGDEFSIEFALPLNSTEPNFTHPAVRSVRWQEMTGGNRCLLTISRFEPLPLRVNTQALGKD